MELREVMGPESVRIAPLGGLGEIGMNCLALEQGDDIVVVDCGTRFPSDDCGVDVIHPDFHWLLQQRARVRAVFLTHGHEDHIGALPYLLEDLNVPVYGPRHALCLVKLRLARHGFTEGDVVLRQVAVGERTVIGSFDFEAIRVSHSIVEATALAIRTRAGIIVHSGDFKFDPEPSDGEVTDEERLLELGEEGVALLLSDSTNVDEVGEAGSERAVRDHLLELVRPAEQRVFVALFASNVQRLISLGHIAQATGRKLCALGTSLQRHIEIALELGHLDWPRDLLLAPERARSTPRSSLLVLVSGTQAEPGSALSRLSQKSNRFLDLEKGDSVIFSSRIIPGHERIVVGMIGDLLRLGVKVEWGRRSGVHTSGHACRAEQERMIQLLSPRAFVPVHGTLHHLQKHAELAKSNGVPDVAVIENGETLVLESGRLRRGANVRAADVHVGLGGAVLDPEILRRRKDLARGGHLSVIAVCDSHARLLEDPKIQTHGVGYFDRGPGPAAELESALSAAWGSWSNAANDALEFEIRRFVATWLEREYGIAPVVAVALSHVSKKALR